MDIINARKRSATDDLFQGAEKVPTPNEHSTSIHPSVDSNIICDPKKDDPQLNEQITTDQVSSGSSHELSFVASHVTANFKDRVDSANVHSRPVTKTATGKFQFKVTEMSNINSMIYSPVHVIGNLTWKLGVKSECSKRTDDKKSLSVYIYCNSESNSIIWSCESNVQFKLLSSDLVIHDKNLAYTFKHGFTCRGFPSFCEWSAVMDPENGYINDDEASIEVEVTIKKIIGFREFSEFDFVSDLPDSKSDVVLIVDGQRMRVCKYYLSMYSPVFHTMFFSDFSERDKKEIVLEDVVPNEFLELLHVIYPTHKPVIVLAQTR